MWLQLHYKIYCLVETVLHLFQEARKLVSDHCSFPQRRRYFNTIGFFSIKSGAEKTDYVCFAMQTIGLRKTATSNWIKPNELFY